MAVKNEGFPDLERYLEERGHHLVTYTEGATMYHIPYYSFVRLAKEAGAECERIATRSYIERL